MMGDRLTLTELVELVKHLGGDPDTTTFTVYGYPIESAESDCEIHQNTDAGAFVVELLPDIYVDAP